MFLWNQYTNIISEIDTKPVQNAIVILKRDMKTVFGEAPNGSAENEKSCAVKTQATAVIRLMDANVQRENGIINVSAGDNRAVLNEKKGKEKTTALTVEAEKYTIHVTEKELIIHASSDLGFIYGILYLSERYLDIRPFWFWMDQKIASKEWVEIPEGIIESKPALVRFRGWFFNDEVLMMKWNYNKADKGWKMAFEALLRCGGNMAIPGTDRMSERNRQLATDMGLWITHHHAEPLGAELFARAYPDVPANYMQYPEKFEKLWEDAVIAQKDCKVVWNVCFRGQGDSPFWTSDTTGAFDTPQKRGRLISDLIRRQCEIVRKYVEQPVFCTNLYGEIMELYEQGFIEFDADIIKIRADNGYGRMVTRRQGNHNPRINAMPDSADIGAQGIYYHVSFYDLQAANHITMLPNSVSFVNRELTEVLRNGGNDFWVINCSNVRPHVYFLDVVRKKWLGENAEEMLTDAEHSREFVQEYFPAQREIMKNIADCYAAWPDAMISYGTHEDEHAGEQLYMDNVRLLARQLLIDPQQPIDHLYWLTGEWPMGQKDSETGTKAEKKRIILAEQAAILADTCRVGLERLEAYEKKCQEVYRMMSDEENACDQTDTDCSGKNQPVQPAAELFRTTLLLQVQLHLLCAKGTAAFGDAIQAYTQAMQQPEKHSVNIKQAFLLAGRSAEYFLAALNCLDNAETGVWETFYSNDCFADIKHTLFMVQKAMGLFRELGDDHWHVRWQREHCFPEGDRNVFLLMTTENHMTDWELYLAMKIEHFSCNFDRDRV